MINGYISFEYAWYEPRILYDSTNEFRSIWLIYLISETKHTYM